jgi:hypothetical protein
VLRPPSGSTASAPAPSVNLEALMSQTKPIAVGENP